MCRHTNQAKNHPQKHSSTRTLPGKMNHLLRLLIFLLVWAGAGVAGFKLGSLFQRKLITLEDEEDQEEEGEDDDYEEDIQEESERSSEDASDSDDYEMIDDGGFDDRTKKLYDELIAPALDEIPCNTSQLAQMLSTGLIDITAANFADEAHDEDESVNAARYLAVGEECVSMTSAAISKFFVDRQAAMISLRNKITQNEGLTDVMRDYADVIVTREFERTDEWVFTDPDASVIERLRIELSRCILAMAEEEDEEDEEEGEEEDEEEGFEGDEDDDDEDDDDEEEGFEGDEDDDDEEDVASETSNPYILTLA